MKREDVERRMSELMLQQVACDHQMQGLRRLHDSAVIVGNADLANQYREQLHAVLDTLLDAANSNMVLARQLASLPPPS